MSPVYYIETISDERLLPYRSLKTRSAKENATPYFIAETHTVIENAAAAGARPLSFLVAEKYIRGRDEALLEKFPQTPVFTAEPEILEQLTGFALTRGILAAMTRPKPLPPEELIRNAHTIVVLENVLDASNIGSIMRSACGLGADGVLLDGFCCDPLHRKAVRTSMGAVFRVPWAQSALSGAELAKTLSKAGFLTLAFALTPEAEPFQRELIPKGTPHALFFGNEGNGLKEETVRTCAKTVILPMKNDFDSLNVSVAAAISLWECAQSR